MCFVYSVISNVGMMNTQTLLDIKLKLKKKIDVSFYGTTAITMLIGECCLLLNFRNF